MATEALTQQFRELINDCTQGSIDELIINPDWGKITFEGCRPELDRTFSMLNQFKLLPLELLPDGPTQQIVNTLPPIHEKIEAWILEQAGVPFVPDVEPGKLRVVTA